MLYLRAELLNKSKEDGKPKSKEDSGKAVSTGQLKGEQKGGQYVARVQTGYGSDGKPEYRYFKTEEEFEAYNRNSGRSKSAKDLEAKVKKEHEESTKKHAGKVVHQPASKKSSLLSVTKKSLSLYVRIDE